MMEVPLRAVPAQSLAVVLGGQSISLRIFARDWQGEDRVYCDVAVDGVWMWQGRICHAGASLKAYPYVGFKGDLRFVDMRGNAKSQEPQSIQWQSLGERWRLVWGTEQEWEEWNA